MKLRSIAIALAFALASAAAHSQAGVYATFDAENFNRTGLLAIPTAGSSNSADPWIYGPSFGVYYDISHIPKLGALHTGPFKVGIDARGDVLRGAQYSRADGLFGLRLSTKTPHLGIKPYIQGSFGVGHTKVPGALYYSNNLAYQFAIGADRKLKHQVEWRVVEASAGFLGNYQAGPNPTNSNYIVTVGTGFVFRLPGK
jgi:hypothetical protein